MGGQCGELGAFTQSLYDAVAAALITQREREPQLTSARVERCRTSKRGLMETSAMSSQLRRAFGETRSRAKIAP
jgi:hypothetical protein